MAIQESVNLKLDTLMRNIANQQCALVIGPEIILEAQEKNFFVDFQKYLSPNVPDVVLWEEGFFDFTDNEQEQDTYTMLRKFYNDASYGAIYEKILAIPFHLIISLSPDTILQRIATEKRYNFQFDYYKKGGKNEDAGREKITKPTAEKPLVYNLFGTIEDSDSLVLTFDALFDYLTSIMGEHKMDDTIKLALSRINHFVLLGFQYEKWYFKLLFKLLTQKEKALRHAYCESKMVGDEIKRFYSQDLKIEFIEDHPKNFIQELFNRYYPDGLRKPMSDDESFAQQVLNKLSDTENNGLVEAVDLLIEKNTVPDLDTTLRSFRNSCLSLERNKSLTTLAEYNSDRAKKEIAIIKWSKDIGKEENES